MNRLYLLLKLATEAAVAWETIMIPVSFRDPNAPTISRLVSRHRWLGAVILGGLAWHLYADPFAKRLTPEA